jgi:GT2 family glycosyltransferase
MNYLFEKSKIKDEDIILLLNNDIEFIDDFSLNNMLNVMQKYNAAIVGSKLLYSDGTISHNGVIFSKRYNYLPYHFRDKCSLEPQDNLNRKFQAVTAACCLIKAKNFINAGGFDTKLWWSFEDIFLNLHVSLIQKELIVCCGNTNIKHITSASLNKNPVHKLFMQKNVDYFKSKWMGKYEIDHDLYLNDINYNVI